MEEHPFPHYKQLADKLFEANMARRYSDEWMEQVVGAIGFGWDDDAIQHGYLDPLYEYFDLHTQRWGPVFASLLIESQGYDPASAGYCLTALEIYHLSSLMLNPEVNRRKQARDGNAKPLPLPVLVTLAYTARQYAPVLADLQKDILTNDNRAWLVYRFSRALSLQGIRHAVNKWNEQHPAVSAGGEYWDEVFRTSNAQFLKLAADVALAVTNQVNAPFANSLHAAAARLSGTYSIIMKMADDTAQQGGVEKLETEIANINKELEHLPPAFANAFQDFIHKAIAPAMATADKMIYA